MKKEIGRQIAKERFEKDMVLRFEYENGSQKVYPTHWAVSNHLFDAGEKEEAAFLHHLCIIAEKNQLPMSDAISLFPAILRMLKSKSSWCD